MAKKSIGLQVLLLNLLLLVSISTGASNHNVGMGIQPNGWLITPEEAAMASVPKRPEESQEQMGADDTNFGPRIEVVTPKEGDQSKVPIEIIINFTQQMDPVDVKSVEVSVLKFISIDITDRVREHVTPKGIHVKEAKIPKGQYTVGISIADINGMYSYKEISFEVT